MSELHCRVHIILKGADSSSEVMCMGGASTMLVTAEEFRLSPTRLDCVSDQSLPLLIWNQGQE